MVAIDLPLEVVYSLMVDCYFGAIARWRDFLRTSLVGEKSDIGTQISMKALICHGDFPMRLIEWSILHHK